MRDTRAGKHDIMRGARGWKVQEGDVKTCFVKQNRKNCMIRSNRLLHTHML